MSRATVHRSPERYVPMELPGAKPAPFPGFVEPCHPTLRQKAPSGGGWLHEIKFDGYRTQAHVPNGGPAIHTRAGYDWTLRFEPIADALATLPAKGLILDGEAVVADSRGIPDFGLLHADLAAGRTDRLLYYAFDLLFLDGFDLRRRSLRSASASSRSCWPIPPSASYTPSTWRETAPRSTRAPALWASKGSSASSRTRRIAPAGWPAGSRSSAASAMRFRSSPSSRSSAPSRAGSPRSMWVAEKGTGCSMPARCAAASRKRRRSIHSSAKTPHSPSRSTSRKRPGWSRRSRPRSPTAQ
jgi:ATP dependent DNA ligase domain